MNDVSIRQNHCGEYITTLETASGDVEGLGDTLADALRDLAENIELSQI